MPAKTEEIVGWATQNVVTVDERTTISSVLCDLLEAIGVEQAFGIVGGANAPFAESLFKSPIELIHTRHEAGAAFAATEASLVSGKPTVVFVTTGPGLLNAITGIGGARWDGAKVILFSGITSLALKGRGGVQETSSYTMPSDGLFRTGALFNFAVELNDAAEIPEISRRLAIGCQLPGGFVAHVALPLSMQTDLVPSLTIRPTTRVLVSGGDQTLVEKCALRLAGRPFVVWVGYGARSAAQPLRALVERTGAAVVCTPRAKGIFPETHPQFIGVTGAGGHNTVRKYMRHHRPAEMLVLGTRMGEASSFWLDDLAPTAGFIQVDLDIGAMGVAYPHIPVLGIQAEIGSFVQRLVKRLPEHPTTAIFRLAPEPELEARLEGPVRPQFVMQAIQRHVIDATDALVMSESGNSFAWANHHLRFNVPGRYITSAQFGAMGQMVAGVVGAALASGGKAIAITGDGAMLMNNEISTAVKYHAQALWVVLNDSRYGITHQAMVAQGFTPVETELPPTSFVSMAESVGASGVRVERESDLEEALASAMTHDGPFVLDVVIDRNEISPVLQARINRLREQGAWVEHNKTT